MPGGAQPVERLIPIRYTVGANDGRGVFGVLHGLWHSPNKAKRATYWGQTFSWGLQCVSTLRSISWRHRGKLRFGARSPPRGPCTDLPGGSNDPAAFRAGTTIVCTVSGVEVGSAVTTFESSRLFVLERQGFNAAGNRRSDLQRHLRLGLRS